VAKRNPQDLTLRNLHAMKKRIDMLGANQASLGKLLVQIAKRLVKLEKGR
jgi:hypothetical protein